MPLRSWYFIENSRKIALVLASFDIPLLSGAHTLGHLSPTHTRTSPSGFCTTTKGDTQVDGESGTASIMSASSSSSIFLSTAGCRLNGMRRSRCATGVTVSSMCSFSSWPFSFPIPSKSCRYWCRMSPSWTALIYVGAGPTRNKSSTSAVVFPMTDRQSPSTPTKSASHFFPFTGEQTSSVNSGPQWCVVAIGIQLACRFLLRAGADLFHLQRFPRRRRHDVGDGTGVDHAIGEHSSDDQIDNSRQ